MITDTGEARITPGQMASFLGTPMMLGVRSRQIRDQVFDAIVRGVTFAAARRQRLEVLLSAMRAELLLAAATPKSHARTDRQLEWNSSPPMPRPIDPVASLTSAPHGPTANEVGAAA